MACGPVECDETAMWPSPPINCAVTSGFTASRLRDVFGANTWWAKPATTTQ